MITPCPAAKPGRKDTMIYGTSREEALKLIIRSYIYDGLRIAVDAIWRLRRVAITVWFALLMAWDKAWFEAQHVAFQLSCWVADDLAPWIRWAADVAFDIFLMAGYLGVCLGGQIWTAGQAVAASVRAGWALREELIAEAKING